VLNLQAESQAQLQIPVEDGPTKRRVVSNFEQVKKQRFSAFLNGICLGVGIVFILLGVLMPIADPGMLMQGLLSIIGGIVVTAIGTVFEVYHWAKLH
jgi:Na+-translocating ferredoxin:NAD+ oxidoreductase RnfE subunit